MFKTKNEELNLLGVKSLKPFWNILMWKFNLNKMSGWKCRNLKHRSMLFAKHCVGVWSPFKSKEMEEKDKKIQFG